MFALISSSILLLAEAAHQGGFSKFYHDWLDVPGFEVWKFINLAIFLGIMSYLLRKPLGDAYRDRRDQIRAELIRAEEEKKAAMARLTSAEAKLAQLETEKNAITTRAQQEAASEKQRLDEATEAEVQRLRQQSEAELARVAMLSRAELRRFSVDEAVAIAEQKLRARIDPAVDARLVKASIHGIGGLN